MNEKIERYIERNIEFYEPVFHVFNLKSEMGRIEQASYQTVDCYDIDSYYLDNLTGDKFASLKGVVEYVKGKVLE